MFTCHHGKAYAQSTNGGDDLQPWQYWISSRGQLIRGEPLCSVLCEGLTTPHRRKPACNEKLQRISRWLLHFGTAKVKENGHEILNLEWKEPPQATITANNHNGISKVWVRFSRSTGGQVEEGWHWTTCSLCTSFHGKWMKWINPKGIGHQQQLLENFNELYGNRRSIAQFIWDRHLSTYRANSLLGKTSTEYCTVFSSIMIKLWKYLCCILLHSKQK